MLKKRETLGAAAAKSGMDEKTARKYLKAGTLPSQMKSPHTWKTRKDPFADVWEDVRKLLVCESELLQFISFGYENFSRKAGFTDKNSNTTL